MRLSLLAGSVHMMYKGECNRRCDIRVLSTSIVYIAIAIVNISALM